MERPTISIPSKRSHHTGYKEMRKLTEAYLRKVKHTLQDESCTESLQSSLQLYFASSQFPGDSSEAKSRTSVLAFIMHATEVAGARIAENKSKPKKAEMSSQTTCSPLREPALGLSEDPVLTISTELGVQTPHSTQETEAKPTETVKPPKETIKTQRYKPIFKTEIGREGHTQAKPVRIQPSQPSVSLYQPRPEFSCETCGEEFWDLEELSVHRYQQHRPRELLSDSISCPVFGCEEHFEDHSDLLLHMRSAHSS